MSLGRVLAQQEAAVLDAQIDKLSGCKTLTESEVVELASKCKVSRGSNVIRSYQQLLSPLSWQFLSCGLAIS